VLAQEGIDADVLIVDDASPDGSAAIARDLAAADSRVRVLEHKTNKGHIATYNEGLSAVDSDYLVLLSADDLLAPGSLARSTALLEAHPEVGLVYGFSPGFRGQPPPARTRPRSWSIWPGQEWLERVCVTARNPVSTPDVVMRASVMRDLVGYDARLPHAADYMLWMRAASRASVGRINGADQAFYRIHGANMHIERYAGVYFDIVERSKTFEILFDEDSAHIPAGDRLHAAARRALAREALVTAGEPYKFGRHDHEPADRLVALAEELDPGVRGTKAWREYERIVRPARDGSFHGLSRRANSAMENVAGKVRWRRWRRNGLLGEVGSI
jgi:glycosyltransferase involved in cell wall biosynthesis